MKKLKLKTEYSHDLAVFLSGILNGSRVILNEDGTPKLGTDGKKQHTLFTRSLDFKEIILVQKTKDDFVKSIEDYAKKYDKLQEQITTIIEISNKKISEFKIEMFEKADKKDGKIPDDYRSKLESFIEMTQEDAKKEIDKEINPSIDKLYEKEGDKEVDLELSDDKYKILVKVFEENSSILFKRKDKMVLIYDAILAGDK